MTTSRQLPLTVLSDSTQGDQEFFCPEWQQTGDEFQVALIHPYLAGASTKSRLRFRESLALGYLTAALELHGYPVDWINADLHRLTPEVVTARILENPRVRLVGISLKAQRAMSVAVDIATIIRAHDPTVHITLGGLLPSSGGAEILGRFPVFDTCVKGEGEAAIVDLANALRQGRPVSSLSGITYREDGTPIQTAERGRVQDLDQLPFPARRDLAYFAEHQPGGVTNANMLATRGCYAACTFCSIHQIYGDRAVARRSPANIVAEMTQLAETYHVKRVGFVDDIFIHPSRAGIRWAYELAERIKEADLGVQFTAEIRADTVEPDLMRTMVDAGLYEMFIGMEAGVDSVLQRMDKGCTVADNERALKVLRSDIGLKPSQINFGYIMFEPDMTFEELRQQYLWLRRSGHATVQNVQNRMNVYWGTPQFVTMHAAGRLTAPEDLGDRWAYEFSDPLVARFEAVIRKFHRWFERECLDEVQPNREVFFGKISKGIVNVPAEPSVVNLISQARNRSHAMELDAYFAAFDTLFDLVDSTGDVPPDAVDQLQHLAEPTIEALRVESWLLRRFAERLEDFTTALSAGQARPGVAWPVDGGRRWVAWVTEAAESGMNGVVADTELELRDRFAHACEPVVIRRAGAGVVVEPAASGAAVVA